LSSWNSLRGTKRRFGGAGSDFSFLQELCPGKLSLVVGKCKMREQRIWGQQIQKNLRLARIPKLLQKCSFQSFDPTFHPDARKMLTASLEALETGSSLILASAICGNGKTHLAVSLLHASLGQGKRGLYLSVPHLAEVLRNEVSGGYSGEGALRFIEKAEVLVLDDLGKANSSGFMAERMYALINSRYLNEQQTIFTTNHEYPEDLEKALSPPPGRTREGGDPSIGRSIISRLIQMCGAGRWVLSRAPDYRMVQAKENGRVFGFRGKEEEGEV
jgi:DNA replication protein DnaC